MQRSAISLLSASRWRATFFLAAILFASACSENGEVTAPPPIMLGTVTNVDTGDPVVGAQVYVGTALSYTDVTGRFAFGGLPAGPSKLKVVATGYEGFETDITVPAGNFNQNVKVTRIETFDFENFSVHVPKTVSRVQGVLIALGGPNTRGFASDIPFGAPVPAAEAALKTMGQELRSLAASRKLAIVGTSLAAMANGTASDQLIRLAVEKAAALSGRPELTSAPFLLYGISGGGRQASGFMARNPERVAGLFVKAPASIEPISTGPALGVPTYVVLAELDAFVNNASLRASFEANRRAGGLWALAMEPGVVHHSLSPAQTRLIINWMSEVLAGRLPAEGGPPLEMLESNGWLGDPVTGEVAPSREYTGDRSSTSWLPSEPRAREWKTFRAGAGG